MSDGEPSFGAVLACMIFSAIFFVIGCWCGTHWTQEGYRAKAIEHGVAEWVVDQKTGESTFQWKEPKP